MKCKLAGLTVLALVLLMSFHAATAEETATLKLPSDLKVIEEEAFCGDSSLDTVIVPEGVTEIGPRAFAGSALREIVLPDSLKSIDDTAFEGVDNVTLTTNEGSYAYEWGLKNGMIEGPAILESEHPYADNACEERSYTYDGEAPGLKVTFSVLTEFEENCDSLTITDAENNSKQYTGRELAGKTVHLGGASFKLLLSSNESVSSFGYRITRVEPMTDEEYAAWQNERKFTTRKLADGTLELTSYICQDSGYVDMVLPQTIDGIPVTSVANSAFRNVSWHWISLTIPEGYVNLDAYALFGCSAVESISIPATLVSLGRNALCSPRLTSITVASDNPAFCVEDGVLFSKEKTSLIRSAVDKEGVYTIPDSVETICANAFNDCCRLTEIVIPDSVKQIEYFAFGNCFCLERISIPASVTALPDQAFAQCEKLTSVLLPEGLIRIGTQAFQRCTSLTSITIPASVTVMGEGIFSSNYMSKTVDVFDRCFNLAEINVAEGNAAYSSQDGVLFDRDAKTLICYPAGKAGRYAIPATVTAIGPTAFSYAAGLTDVQIPNGVSRIEKNTFLNCSGLTSITIPESVIVIGASAFYNCSSLSEITVPEGVTSIGTQAFSYCKALTDVHLPASLVSIDDTAFEYSYNVVIHAPKGSDAYRWAEERDMLPKSEPIVTPEPTPTPDPGSDPSTITLNNVVYALSGDAATVLDYTGNDTALELPKSVAGLPLTGIGNLAFDSCTALVSVSIPDSVTSIGDSAFYGCSALTDVSMPDGLTSLSASAFSGCTSLISVSIPDSVASIGDSAFYGCSALTDVAMPDGLTSLGASAFSGCTKLTSADLPKCAGNIADSTFEGCIALTRITIPNSATSIGHWAFKDCISLTEVLIPSGITSIGNFAFQGCTNLKKVEIPNSVNSIGTSAFQFCKKLECISIPSGVTTIAASTFFGCSRMTVATFPAGVTTIGDSAFRNCSSLKSIDIPHTVTNIGQYAFCDCDYLSSITIPASVTSIGNFAFMWCEGLTSVTLSDGLTSIGVNAFQSCYNLTSIRIPGSVGSIGNSAFTDCIRLGNVEILDGVTNIAAYAFYDCSALTSIYIPDSVTTIGNSAIPVNDNLTIYGAAGSAAEEYADGDNIKFVVWSPTA